VSNKESFHKSVEVS